MNDEEHGAAPGESSVDGGRPVSDGIGHFEDTELRAFAIGRLDPAAAEPIESHLESCDECGLRLDRLIRSDSFVGRLRGDTASSESKNDPAASTVTPLTWEGSASRATSPHEIGRAFRNHRLMAILGSGGMGVVYRARDLLIGRDVALKVLHEAVARDPVSRARFLAEARAQGQLNHSNIVTIYSIDDLQSTMYIVMELAPGGSMADRLKRSGALGWNEATRAMMQASRGLAAAHAAGLIHRDIKPENLLIDADGNVKLGDFGLAKAPDAVSITHSRELVGTPQFMSPEQCRCERIDPRSDIYQMGATYFKLLTGSNPYPQATTPLQAINAHCNFPVPDPRSIDASIPDDCAAIVLQAMAKSVADRHQTTEELFADLIAVRDSVPVTPSERRATAERRRRRAAAHEGAGGRPWIALVVLLMVAILAVVGYLNRPERKSPSHRGMSTAVPEGDPIHVGILHSLSGTMADSEAPVVDVVLLAIRELNEAGGLLGRRIEPVVADGRSDPAVFAQQAERLITEKKVSVVFGCWTSASRKTVVPIFEQHDHLLVYPVQYEGLEQSRNVIYTGAAPNQQLLPAVRWAFAFQNSRRFFLVGSDYVFPRTAHVIIKDELEELGAELVGEEYLRLGSSDVDPVVRKILAARPDIILNTINGDSNIPFFRVLRANGLSPQEVPTISFSIGEVELMQLDIEQMVGDYACWTYFQSVDDPVNERFVRRFRAKYGPQRVITDPMEAAYFSVKLWAQAVLSANSTEVEKTRAAMCELPFRAPQGLVRVDCRTQHTVKTPRIGRVRADGQFEVIWQAAPVPPVPYPPSRTREEWERLLSGLYRKWGGRWSAPALSGRLPVR